MSKKKSYMDRKNILSEGIIGTLLYNILPTGVTRFLTKNDPELKAIEKKIQQSEERSEEAYQEWREWIISRGGVDPDEMDDKKYKDKFKKTLWKKFK